MSVSPSNIDISKALKLSITGKYHSHQHTWVNIALNKAFSLSLTEWGPSNATERRREMDEYNTLGGNVIWAQLLNTFENEEAKILRDWIERSVSRINSPIFNWLSDEQKEDFYRRVLDVTYTTLPYIPYPTWTHDRRWLAACLEHYCNYTDFSNWFTADGRGRNKNANTTRTPQTYRQYVHDHFQEESKNYFNTQIDRILSNLTNETAIKAALSNYLVDIENNKRDNQTVRNAVDSGFNDKETKMEKKRWWQVFRNKDENFMRFFAGSSKEFKDQSVNLITTNKNNPVNKWPIKYDMKIDVAQNNKLWVELKIAWWETLVLQSWDWDPSSLARRILREPSIWENKVRVHMVYNLYKGLLQLANEKHMKLSYFQEANPRGMHEIKLENNNFKLLINLMILACIIVYKNELMES